MYENSPINKAKTQLEEAQKRIEDIDKTLVYLDQILDAIQPRFEPGKLRIIFKEDRGVTVPMIIKMKGRGRRPTKIKMGQSTRNVRVSKNFKLISKQVKLVCRAAEDLMETRRSINLILGRLSAAIIGQASRQQKMLKIRLASLATLKGMDIDPMSVSLFLSNIADEKTKSSSDDLDWIYDEPTEESYFIGLDVYDESRLDPALRKVVNEVFALGEGES